MIGIPIALAVSNVAEWLIHKYVLHGQGKNKRSYWAFHWHEHHREAHKNGMLDPNYERSVFGWHAQGKEALGLVAMGALTLPLFPVAPFFTATSIYCMARYYVVHKRAHQDPAWAREHLPWHYDHHMGVNQHSNWCVTKPWADIVFGTREPFIGTDKEKAVLSRKKRELTRREAGLESAVRLGDVLEAEAGDGERLDHAVA